jgi:hypothetical protein
MFNQQSLIRFDIHDDVTDMSGGQPYGSQPNIGRIILPAKLQKLQMDLSNYYGVNIIDFTKCEQVPILNTAFKSAMSFVSFDILLPNRLYDMFKANEQYFPLWYTGWFKVSGEYVHPIYDNTVVVDNKHTIIVELENYETEPQVDILCDKIGLVIDNIVITKTQVSFDVLGTIEDDYNIIVNINGEEHNERSFTIHSINNAPASTFTVENIEGDTYGYDLTSDGYYTSNNSNKINTWATCQIHVSNPNHLPVYIDYIYHVGGAYATNKPAVFSKPNCDFSKWMLPDVADVYYKVKTANNKVQTLEYITDLSDYYITVKYSNNQTSSSYGNNALKFNVRFGEKQ